MAKSTTNPAFRDLTRTPPWLFRAFNKFYDHRLDVACLPESALCREFITPEIDALSPNVSWANRCPLNDRGLKRAWCNPPYSNIKPWVDKAYHEAEHGLTTSLLLPADATCSWWPVSKTFDLITITGSTNPVTGRWESGRIAFINAETGQPMTAPQGGSVLLIVGPDTKDRHGYVRKQTLMREGGAT